MLILLEDILRILLGLYARIGVDSVLFQRVLICFFSQSTLCTLYILIIIVGLWLVLWLGLDLVSGW